MRRHHRSQPASGKRFRGGSAGGFAAVGSAGLVVRRHHLDRRRAAWVPPAQAARRGPATSRCGRPRACPGAGRGGARRTALAHGAAELLSWSRSWATKLRRIADRGREGRARSRGSRRRSSTRRRCSGRRQARRTAPSMRASIPSVSVTSTSARPGRARRMAARNPISRSSSPRKTRCWQRHQHVAGPGRPLADQVGRGRAGRAVVDPHIGEPSAGGHVGDQGDHRDAGGRQPGDRFGDLGVVRGLEQDHRGCHGAGSAPAWPPPRRGRPPP